MFALCSFLSPCQAIRFVSCGNQAIIPTTEFFAKGKFWQALIVFQVVHNLSLRTSAPAFIYTHTLSQKQDAC